MRARVSHDKKACVLEVSVRVPFMGAMDYQFRWITNDDCYSGFLAEAVNKSIHEIKVEAYAQGFRDAKAKRAKRYAF